MKRRGKRSLRSTSKKKKRVQFNFKKRLFIYFFAAIAVTTFCVGMVVDIFFISRIIHHTEDQFFNISRAMGDLITQDAVKRDWDAVADNLQMGLRANPMLTHMFLEENGQVIVQEPQTPLPPSIKEW